MTQRTVKSQSMFLTYLCPMKSCLMKEDYTWDKLSDYREVCDMCLKEVSLKEGDSCDKLKYV